jgi:50S ribosomal protein L16 3-hydroxylase
VKLRWPKGLEESTFLAHYWQRRPLLLRQAFDPHAFDLPDADTLAGLSLHEEVESRLLRRHAPDHWQLIPGPQDEETLANLPPRNWTLLVQDLDSLLPDTARLFDLVAFIPAWRREDLMLSVAAPGGSVGPHVDQYDVFLAQVRGAREWRVGSAKHDPRTLPEAPLRVLQHFVARQNWVLQPGDILYLPPGVPHHGIGVQGTELCMTASLGFRAPAALELAALLLEERTAPASLHHYADADLQRGEAASGEIGAAAIARLQALLASLPEEPAALARAMGRLVTETKPWLAPAPRARAPTAARLAGMLTAGRELTLAPGTRVAWTRTAGAAALFVNGQVLALPAACTRLARALAGAHPRVTAAVLPQGATRAAALALLRGLYRDGYLQWHR